MGHQVHQNLTHNTENLPDWAKEISLEKLEARYLKLKKKLDYSNVINQIKWTSLSEEQSARIAEFKKKQENSDQAYLPAVIPDSQFFTGVVIPGLIERCKDQNDFENHLKFSFQLLTTIAEASCCAYRSKEAAVYITFQQYFDYFFDYSNESVLALGHIQGMRTNYWNDGLCNFLEDYQLSDIIDLADFNQNYAEALLVSTAKGHSKQESRLESIVNLVSEFREQDLADWLPAYFESIQISDEFHGDYGKGLSNDQSEYNQQVIGFFKRLEATGPIAKAAHQLFLRQQSNVAGVKGIVDSSGNYFLEAIEQLSSNNLLADQLDALARANSLAKVGIDAKWLLHDWPRVCSMTSPNTDGFFRYAEELASLSKASSSTFLNHADHIFKMDPRDRDEYLTIGLELTREHGDTAQPYFHLGALLFSKKNFRKAFQQYVEAFDAFAKLQPDQTENFSKVFFTTTVHQQQDRFLSVALTLAEQLPQSKKTDDLWSEDEVIVAFRILNNFFTTAVKNQHIFQAIEGGESQFVEDIINYFNQGKIKSLQEIDRVLLAGIEYQKYLPLAEEITLLGFSSHAITSKLAELINSSLREDEKRIALRDYRQVLEILQADSPNLDSAGEWRTVASQKLRNKLAENTNIALENIPLDELCLLACIQDNPDFDEKDPRLQLLIEQSSKRETALKHFPLAKPYQTVLVSGLRRLEDPLTATEKLLAALTKPEYDPGQDLDPLFDSDLIQQARLVTVNQRKRIYNVIKNDLQKMRTGSYQAGKSVLNHLRSLYCNNEIISDLISATESLFETSSDIDSLTKRSQTGTLHDLYSNTDFHACTFYPSGAHRSSAINYLLDPDIGLLHVKAGIGQREQQAIGVGITFRAINIDTRKKLLAVDSVEGGAQLKRIPEEIWMPSFHQSLIDFARDAGCESLFYGSAGFSGLPRRYMMYLQEAYRQDPLTLRLAKLHTADSVLAQSWQASKNHVQDHYEESLRRHFGQYLETLRRERWEIPSDLAAELGPYPIIGSSQGFSFQLS